jgi:hypothetical protein
MPDRQERKQTGYRNDLIEKRTVGINCEITISSQTCASSLIFRRFKPATRTPLLVMLFLFSIK